ncbi:MAG: FG-GAP repeat domain-containing protein, partial [Phycisphaerae bacterium]
VIIVGLARVAGCAQQDQQGAPPAGSARKPLPQRDALVAGPYPCLLLSKAQFEDKRGLDGRPVPVPGYAKLVLWRKTNSGWQSTVIEDPDSNVFHKAMLLTPTGQPARILTIGGTEALMKRWQWQGTRWTQETLWHPTFGGTWNRLRDVEFGDVTGDGTEELIVATHDQGVVAVLTRSENGWASTELGRSPRTFVHEIEFGDIDGDGMNEFFATPSQPNKASMVSQTGRIVMYRYVAGRFVPSTVDVLHGTHAKEILFVPRGDGKRASLVAAVEARTALKGGALVTVEPVRIVEYRFKPERFVTRVVAELNDRQCRFLVSGDVDGDGREEIIASGMNSGIWMLKPAEDGMWVKTLIDANSGGIEHAVLLVDIDESGRDDIVVASDRQRQLRRYRWTGSGFAEEVIGPLPDNEITFHIGYGKL